MDVTTNNTKSKVNIRLLVGTGMLSGLAFVLQYLEFPIPIMPFFIRFDFSDLPALIGAFAYGPLAGVIVEFIKNLLHCTVTQRDYRTGLYCVTKCCKARNYRLF